VWPVLLFVACLGAPSPVNAGHGGSDFQRMRASAAVGAQVVFHWSGELHELRPGQAAPSSGPLLHFEGYNIGRVVADADGTVQLLSREVTVYRDPQGQILDCWTDPWSPQGPGRQVQHVRNDQVNFTLGERAPRIVDDRAIWALTLPVAYPSPMPVSEFPDHAPGSLYQSLEMFTFEAALAHLRDPGQASVPARLSWSRVGPWLPWMGRGQAPGWLVYHATGAKLLDGFAGLPDWLQAWVREHAAAWEHAPTEPSGPKQTSWSTFASTARDQGLPAPCQP